MPASGFDRLYRDAFAALDLDLTDAHGGSQAEGMPEALAAWHRLTGGHPANAQGNRLLPPEEVHLHDGRLVFFEEEQGAILWGAEPEGDDPPVWQGVRVEEGDDIFWYDEEMTVSAFLVAMLRWKTTGEAPER